MSLLLQKLPSEVVFIFKAMHIIGLHNRRAGGTTRDRLLKFTDYSIEAISGDNLYHATMRMGFRIKLMIFEKLFWLYKMVYGFSEYSLPKADEIA